MITSEEVKVNNKYYIICCNSFYEVRLKNREIMCDKTTKYTFSSRLGDLHFYRSEFNIWSWQTPKIFEDRFEAILELGVDLFKGKIIRRLPYTQDKHIMLSMKYIPEKMI